MTGPDGARPAHDGRRAWILGLETATSRALVFAADRDGRLLGAITWDAGQRPGEGLLRAVGRLTGEANLRRSRIAAVAVGLGPGGFTGLRVAVATAKTIAHGLGRSLLGISTGSALLEAAGIDVEAGVPVLVLPAGPSDRVELRVGTDPVRIPGGIPVTVAPGERLVAIDLEGRAPEPALAAGRRALDRLPAVLARAAAARLASGDADDPATLVPIYVTPPRGLDPSVGAEVEEVGWSRGRP